MVIVLGGAAVAMFGVTKVVDTVEGVVDDVFGTLEEEVAVPDGERPRIKECTAQQLVDDRRCKGLPVVVMDAKTMPYITRNIQLAWAQGKPALLTRVTPAQKRINRRIACSQAARAKLPGSCDEYSFAVSAEGGANARVEGVPFSEQKDQAKAICSTLNRSDGPKIGDQFLVIIVNPSRIQTSPYAGEPDPSDPPELC